MNKLLITGLLLLFSVSCYATCIVVYLSENGNIYVAADSRRTFIFDNSAGNHKFESVCKIHHVNNSYFAISGIDDGGLLRYATKALQQNSDIDSAIRSFGNAMTVRYKRLMTDTRTFYPDKFRHFLTDGLGTVCFFGFYNGTPNVANIQFLCNQDANGKILVTYTVRPVNVITVIGMSRDITNSTKEELPSESTRQQNPELYVEELVKIEAKKQPLSVSEPIDILELSPTGPNWIRKNDNAESY